MSTIINRRQFNNYRKFEMELAGRPLTLEVGKLAELANAAVMVGYGDTRVLVCATAAARPRDGIDFFPLSVDFEEKLYSVGRIPGSFNRREGRPGEKGILTARVIDRPIRPLFPYDFRNDVSIMPLLWPWITTAPPRSPLSSAPPPPLPFPISPGMAPWAL